MAVVPLAICLYLAYLAVRFNHEFALADSSRWPFILAPLAGAIAVASVTIVGGKMQTRRRVILTPAALIYDAGKEDESFQVAWKSLAYSLPFNQKQFVRTMLIATSDSKTARIHDIFMPNFDKLAAEIKNRKTRAITVGTGSSGTTIESGKVGSIDPALLGRGRAGRGY